MPTQPKGVKAVPITQEQMLDLLHECESHAARARALSTEIRDYIVFERKNHSGDLWATLAAIEAIIQGVPIVNERVSAVTSAHYKKFARKNLRTRERATLRRLGEGGAGARPTRYSPPPGLKPIRQDAFDGATEAGLPLESPEESGGGSLAVAPNDDSPPTPEQLAADEAFALELGLGVEGKG